MTRAGSGLPVLTVTMTGLTISVVVRFVRPSLPPGRNSDTVPPTFTESPTETVGAPLVKTKMPSDVASSLSGVGSCM